MKDVLIPLGLLLFLVLLVYALISGARKQRKAKRAVFRDLAREAGLRYEAKDGGRARQFSQDMDALGQFRSPSLGDLIPEDVVRGTLRGLAVVLFRHRTRFYEGYSREWWVAGVQADRDLAERCSVQLLEGSAAVDSIYLRDSVVKQKETGSFRVVVRAPSESAAGRMADDDVLQRLSRLARSLPFRAEIQIRGSRVAAYLADRNATIEGVEDLRKLLDFSFSVASMA
jgi:hypothetical protein